MKKLLHYLSLMVFLNSLVLGFEIKNLYSLYELEGNFNRIRLSDIYVFLDTDEEISVIDMIERVRKSRYKIFRCKHTIDFVVTNDKYGYILHNTGIEVVDFFKPSKPVFIECFKFPKDLNIYNPLRLYLAEIKDILYVNYSVSNLAGNFLPVSIKRRYEPRILDKAKNRNFSNILFSSSYILKKSMEGFEVISIIDPVNPKAIGFYTVKEGFSKIESLKFDLNFAYLQHDNIVDIVDLSNPLEPSLVKQIQIKGVLKDVEDKKMFIANGESLQIKDISNLENIRDIFEKNLGRGVIKDIKFYNNFVFILTNREFSIYSPVKIPKPKSALDEFIERLYKDILKREPDESGFKYWKEAFLNGERARDVIKYFFTSEEFKKQNVNNEEFLKRLYNTVLSRNPDVKGYNYWMREIEDKGVSREEVIEKFIQSEEFEKLARNYGIQP